MAEYSRAEKEMALELVSLKDKMKRAAKDHEAEITVIKEAAIATVTAGAISYVQGRYPARAQVAKIPLSGVVAFAALGYGLSGYAGKSSEEILAVGTGAACAYAADLGRTKGTAAAAPAA